MTIAISSAPKVRYFINITEWLSKELTKNDYYWLDDTIPYEFIINNLHRTSNKLACNIKNHVYSILYANRDYGKKCITIRLDNLTSAKLSLVYLYITKYYGMRIEFLVDGKYVLANLGIK